MSVGNDESSHDNDDSEVNVQEGRQRGHHYQGRPLKIENKEHYSLSNATKKIHVIIGDSNGGQTAESRCAKYVWVYYNV